MSKYRVVIGVSAVSGGGKTLLVAELVKLLGNAVPICFDDFDATTEHPPDLREWLSAGGDYNAYRTPGLITQLEQLREGSAGGNGDDPTEYIVFDAPLGRAHAETGKYIDHMVFVDTPLDIAMARRLIRDGRDVLTDEHLHRYLDWTRELFTHHIEQVSATADLVVDGTLPAQTLARLVVDEFQLKSSA